MLHRRVACLLSFTVALAQEPKHPGEAEFDAGITTVHAAMQKAKWAEARAALLELVKVHTGKVYVQAQCAAIASDLRTCAFYAVAKPPKIAELITGKIVSFDERSGRIKVVYADSYADWKGEEEMLVNPLVFAGSYTVTMSGKAYMGGNRPLSLWFDMDPDGSGWFLADFGNSGDGHTYFPACILQGRGEDKPLELAKDSRNLITPGQPYKAVVKVGDGQVEMTLDNKPLFKVKRERVEFGQVGIRRSTCDELVLEGKIEPACLQSRVDEELARQREEFDKTFDAKKELPAWLFERPSLRRTPALSDDWIPGLRGQVSKSLEALLKTAGEGKYAEAGAALAKFGDGDAPPAARAFLEAWLAVKMGRPERAEPICAKLLAGDAEMTQARLLRGQALEEMGRCAEAIAEFEAARQRDPGYAPAHELLCVALLRKSRTDEARRAVLDAKTKHGLWDDVEQLDAMLAMSARGPNWPRRFVHKSTHYEVASDIDQKICFEASRVLEASYVNLMGQLSWIKEDKNLPRFRVFLFSGESGYQDYVKAIIGEAVPHTAGLFTPVLKQLLIWNVPRREDMVRTIRHEGFHQFLDRIMDNPPSWLNEGTAEFWETAKHADGRLQGGQPRPDHLATLARSRKALPKLKDFVYGGDGDFYAFAQQRYAQGWALVHFLRNGPPAYTALFGKLWSELRSAKSRTAALDSVFAKTDWDKFEQDFWAYLGSLK